MSLANFLADRLGNNSNNHVTPTQGVHRIMERDIRFSRFVNLIVILALLAGPVAYAQRPTAPPKPQNASLQAPPFERTGRIEAVYPGALDNGKATRILIYDANYRLLNSVPVNIIKEGKNVQPSDQSQLIPGLRVGFNLAPRSHRKGLETVTEMWILSGNVFQTSEAQ